MNKSGFVIAGEDEDDQTVTVGHSKVVTAQNIHAYTCPVHWFVRSSPDHATTTSSSAQEVHSTARKTILFEMKMGINYKINTYTIGINTYL